MKRLRVLRDGRLLACGETGGGGLLGAREASPAGADMRSRADNRERVRERVRDTQRSHSAGVAGRQHTPLRESVVRLIAICPRMYYYYYYYN